VAGLILAKLLFTFLAALYITIAKAYTPKGSREKSYL
jgi:hypothetical protein